MSRTISKAEYQSRPGDKIRLAGRRLTRSLPVWSATRDELRDAVSVLISPTEEMTIVGRVPYSCSYDWVADRGNSALGLGRWVMLRDSDFVTTRTVFQTCIGQTAVVRHGTTSAKRGDIVVIMKKYMSDITYVDGLRNGDEVRRIPLLSLEIMVAGPEGFTCDWERFLS
jgi:hypothetical protein